MPNDFLMGDKNDWVGYKHERTQVAQNDSRSMHMHNRYEFIYFLSGDLTHAIEDRRYKITPGDLILLHPRKSHFIQIDSPSAYERYIVGFDDKLMGFSLSPLLDGLPEVINISKVPEVGQVFERMNFYRKNLSDGDMQKIFPSLVTELIYSVSIASRGETARQATVSHPILSEALAYINENLLTLKSISEIAERLFVTEGYLFRLFKTELRQTPRRYITDKRLLLARAMILGGERPTDVYAKCGFADYATFYRNYKLFFKRSPSDDVER